MKKFFLSLAMIGMAVLVLSACGSTSSKTSASNSGSSSSSSNSSNSSSSNSSTSSTDPALAKLQKQGYVTVGFANEKPYAYKDNNGQLTGEAVAIAKAVFKQLGVPVVKGKLADWSQLIPGLKAGKFDVITAGMAINPKRCKQVAFGEPEIKYGEGLVVKKGNPLKLHSYKDIANNPKVKVSVMAGATENNFLKQEGVKASQIQSAPDIPATFAAVQSGRAAATTGTGMTLKMALKSANANDLQYVSDFTQPNIKGIPSYGGAAFSKNNTGLRDAYNKVLEQLKQNGKILPLIQPFGFTKHDNIITKNITTKQLCNG